MGVVDGDGDDDVGVHLLELVLNPLLRCVILDCKLVAEEITLRARGCQQTIQCNCLLCENTAMRNIKPLLSGTADMTSSQIVLLYSPIAIAYV